MTIHFCDHISYIREGEIFDTAGAFTVANGKDAVDEFFDLIFGHNSSRLLLGGLSGRLYFSLN